MDGNNWRLTAPSGEAPMDMGDWRTQLQPDTRQRIVNKIMETLKRHLPFFGQEGLQELKKIAVRFEKKIYTAATSQPDYLRKISLKMLIIENKSQNTIPVTLPAIPSGNSNTLTDSGASQSIEAQVHYQEQDLSIPLLCNQSQVHRQLLSQNLQNNSATAGVQGSTDLASALLPVFGITQTTMARIVGQNNMENVSGMTPNSVGNSMGQMVPSDVFSNAQRQMPGRQPAVPQQQQQLQNSQHLYQQQLLKLKFQQLLMSSDVQHQQQQQQQNNQLQQQLHHQQQQQQLLLMAQQNNLSTMHQSQLGSQNTVVLQQPLHLLGSHPDNPNLPTDQHTIQMLQPKVPMQQQSQQTGTNLLATPGQQSQQQLNAQIQALPLQLRQQVGLQLQSDPMERDLQERLQVPGQGAGSLLQSQSLVDQHKQLYLSQRPLLETSFTSLDATQMGQINGTDWQEEVYQKVKQMKETYLPELSEMYQKIVARLQQHDSLPQLKSDQLEKLKIFKHMVEHMISVVQMTKSNITPNFKEKLPACEKQISNFLTSNRPRKPVSSMQQRVSQPYMQSMQQTQSQVPHVQTLESHMNTPLESMNLPVSASTIPQNSMSSMQHNSLPSLSGVSMSQQNFMNQLQSDSNMDAGQGCPLGSLQQVAVGYLQQNAVSTFQQSGISSLSSQTGVSMPYMPIQSNSNMLQQQQQELMLETQQLNQQIQQCQMQQYLQKQQQWQQQQQQQHLHQQSKQQLPSQMQTLEVAQLHQISDANEIKIRQGMGVKPGIFEHHLSTGQCASYSDQCASYSHHLLPFVALIPPTPMASSLMPGDPEKPSLSNVRSIGHQQTTAARAPVPSLAIGAPVISASPLLSEFTGPDGTHVALTTVSSKSSVTEQPLKGLLLRCIMLGILIVGFLLFHEWITNTY